MGSGPEGEKVAGAEDEDPGLDAAKSQIAADGVSKTCFGHRFVLDPARHLLVDLPAGKAVATGEKAINLGLAGVEFAIDTGRTAAGREAAPTEAREV